MYAITVRARFKAAHSVQIGTRPREAPHSHDWLVEVEVGAHELDRDGLVMDFHALERLLNECLADFQGALLDERADFAPSSPTAENVARTVFGRLEARLPDERCVLVRVTVWETESCAATYRADRRA
jgi:6-pyruvoyltetrahydropterin/6-carboxytetrahydropterin synthase